MKNSVLVTGASGFIGRHLCRRLRDNGFHVRALMRRPVEGPWDAAVRLELGKQAIPPDLLAGVDCIFHLAGKAHAVAEGAGAEEEYQIANVVSTHDLLRAARAEGVRGFVYFSSIKAMGEEGEASAAAAPDSPYGRSKLAAEQAVLNSGSVPHPVVLRPALVYGPHPKGYLELMIRGVRAGWFPPLPELGNRRSMIHLDDLVEAAMLCARDARACGRSYVVTDGTPYSTRQIYDCILQSLGRRPPRWNLPVGLLRLAAWGGDGIGRLRGHRFLFDTEVLDKLIGSACYDGSQIYRELGFRPRHSLRGAMRDMVESL